MMRLLVLVLCIFGFTSVRAAVSCDVLLASEISEASQNDAVTAYVNLIQLYIKRAEASAGELVVDKVLSSGDFVNPFANRADSFSTQLTSAIERLRSKIDQKDWLEIKDLLAAVTKREKTQNQDRAEKEVETAIWVFKPKIKEQVELAKNTNIEPVWLEFNERVFLVSIKKPIISRAVIILNLSELINGRLVHHQAYEVPSFSLAAMEWRIVDGRAFLVCGEWYNEGTQKNGDEPLQIAELVNNKLEPRNLEDVRGHTFLKYTTDAHFEDYYLSLSWAEDELYLFEYRKNGKSKKIDTINISAAKYFEWKREEDRLFILINHAGGDLTLFELVNNKLKKMTTKYVPIGLNVEPSWFTFDGRTFAMASGFKRELYFYELVDGQLLDLGTLSLNDMPMGRASWQVAGNEVFVSFNTTNGLSLVKVFEKMTKR